MRKERKREKKRSLNYRFSEVNDLGKWSAGIKQFKMTCHLEHVTAFPALTSAKVSGCDGRCMVVFIWMGGMEGEGRRE